MLLLLAKWHPEHLLILPSIFIMIHHQPPKNDKKKQQSLYPSHHTPRFDPPLVECLERVPPKVQHIESLNVAVDRTTNPRISRSGAPRVAWQSENVQVYPEGTRGRKISVLQDFLFKDLVIAGEDAFCLDTKKKARRLPKQIKTSAEITTGNLIKESWVNFKCNQYLVFELDVAVHQNKHSV